MKKFDLFVENCIENINEGRIAHKNKNFKVKIEDAKKHIDRIPDENPTKAFYVKMVNSLENENTVFTPDSFKKFLEISLLNDTSSSVAKSLAKDFTNYLNVRDAFETVSSESNSNQYSEDVAQEIIKTLQDQPETKEKLFDILFKKGFVTKNEKDFEQTLNNLKSEKEIEEKDGKLQIAKSEDVDFEEDGMKSEKDVEILDDENDDFDLEKEEPSAFKRYIDSIKED